MFAGLDDPRRQVIFWRRRAPQVGDALVCNHRDRSESRRQGNVRS